MDPDSLRVSQIDETIYFMYVVWSCLSQSPWQMSDKHKCQVEKTNAVEATMKTICCSVRYWYGLCSECAVVLTIGSESWRDYNAKAPFIDDTANITGWKNHHHREAEIFCCVATTRACKESIEYKQYQLFGASALPIVSDIIHSINSTRCAIAWLRTECVRFDESHFFLALLLSKFKVIRCDGKENKSWIKTGRWNARRPRHHHHHDLPSWKSLHKRDAAMVGRTIGKYRILSCCAIFSPFTCIGTAKGKERGQGLMLSINRYFRRWYIVGVHPTDDGR